MPGLLKSTINKVKARNKRLGLKTVKPKSKTAKKPKAKPTKKRTVKPTTTKSKAAAQKAAIRKRVAARIANAGKKR